MIQCSECEFFDRLSDGTPLLRCDPFANIKEPECLAKLQLVRLDTIVRSYKATEALHRRMAPLQEKMMRHMEREIDEAEDADRWKYDRDDEYDRDDD